MKKLLKPFLKFSLIVASLYAVVAGILLFSAYAPILHSDYIRNTVGNKVVMVMHPEGGGGTGFHVTTDSGNTYILTNKHLCPGKEGDILFVKSLSKGIFPRRIIHRYAEHDLCILEAIPGVKGVKLSSSNPKIGEVVAIVGHPRLNALTLARGEIIDSPVIELVDKFNVKKEKCDGRFIDLSKTIYILMGIESVCLKQYTTNQATYISYPGNSGSPVVNFFGRVVGVHFAGDKGAVTDGFMVPLEEVKNFLKGY